MRVYALLSRLSILALALTVLVTCKKKEEQDESETPETIEMAAGGTEMQPTTPETEMLPAPGEAAGVEAISIAVG